MRMGIPRVLTSDNGGEFSVMRGVASADKASAITNLSHARTQGVLYQECRTLHKRSNTGQMESITP